MKRIARILLVWYDENKRDLPWRNSKDPYKIWLSEVILQQTRVQQGMEYYHRFVEKYPTIFALADAPSDAVFKLWQGLGYYRRAENLLKTAKIVAQNFQGQFPENFETLKQLPGIGDYTAAAIASIAFNRKNVVLDGNVYRWLSRMFAITTPIHTAKAKKEFGEIGLEILHNNSPSLINQAMMEFGALYCLPENPVCSHCVFQQFCAAFQRGEPNLFPVKRPTAKVTKRYFVFYLLETNNCFLIHKRIEKDIWKNLYDFPYAEAKVPFEEASYFHTAAFRRLTAKRAFVVQSISTIYQHQLTHQRIFAVFIRIILKEKPKLLKNSLLLVDKNNLKNYPVPKLIDRYLQDQELLTV